MSKRGELLKMYSERGFSFDAMQKTGELLSDMTDSMKEEKAAAKKIADPDGSGKITFENFVKLMEAGIKKAKELGKI